MKMLIFVCYVFALGWGNQPDPALPAGMSDAISSIERKFAPIGEQLFSKYHHITTRGMGDQW